MMIVLLGNLLGHLLGIDLVQASLLLSEGDVHLVNCLEALLQVELLLSLKHA